MSRPSPMVIPRDAVRHHSWLRAPQPPMEGRPSVTTSWNPSDVSHPGRQSWDDYFLTLSRAASTRATCSRRKHGAVIVKGRRIVSTGYNGSPSGFGHCDEGACPRAASDAPQGHMYDNCIAIHAEANALLFSSPEERDGSTLYCTGAPCFGCAKLIANSGVSEVVASGGRYDGWDEVRDFLRSAGVRVRLVDGMDDHSVLPLELRTSIPDSAQVLADQLVD